MDEQPLISIIVPVYKVEQYLEKCIKSILAQTHTNFELILVDDGSPDSCPEICEEYAKIDSRIIVIHKENGGLSDARNAGLDIAKGAYIGFVDSDDYISEEMYFKLLKAIISADADMAICNYLIVDENDSQVSEKNSHMQIRNTVYFSNDFMNDLCGNCGWYYVVAWNKLYKKEIFEKLRFPVGLQHEDVFIIHHVVYSCKKIVGVSEPLYYYFQRESSIMSSSSNVKRMDLGEALVDRYKFARKNKLRELQRTSATALLYKMELWGEQVDDHICRKKYYQILRNAKFLFREIRRNKDFSFKGKLYWQFKLLFPQVNRYISHNGK